MIKNPPVIHPFLLALFPILALYSVNTAQTPVNQIVMPIAMSTTLAFLLWTALSFGLKNKKKAGLLVSLFLLLFFSYGHFHNGLLLAGFEIGRHRYLVPIWGLLLIGGSYLLIQTGARLHHHTLVLNLIAAFLLISPLLQIVPYELEKRALEREIAQARDALSHDINAPGRELVEPEAGPDIYYLIFDQYANPNIARDYFDYDNSDFIDYLVEQGFYVADDSQTNYPSTFLSLASSLNMTYLDFLEPVKESDNHLVVYKMLDDYRVWRFLKARGYKFIHFGDWWDPTIANPYADMNFNYNPLGLNGFTQVLLQTTALDPVVDAFLGDMEAQNRQRILYKFEKLAEIPEIEGPKFVFAHMLIPHGPYVFGPNGEPLTKAEAAARSEAENYFNQLTFANSRLKLLIDAILAKSSSPPIIIIQSDEGPLIAPEFLASDFLPAKDWSRIGPEALKTHLKIFNVYYLPDIEPSLLNESISPVNTFRLIFNLYFGADYELLKDRSYISKGPHRPYNFIEADLSSQ